MNPLTVLFAIIPTTACAAFAGILALHDKGNWGWFIVAALLVTPRVSGGEK